ncbi:hypothetical protein [Streptomyces sp. NPDC056045]|uniref:hypothetical protein n=1 Tax=Streptomyces sp. NPDC056045 TaxID=3345691 RepID=UPI0035D88A30
MAAGAPAGPGPPEKAPLRAPRAAAMAGTTRWHASAPLMGVEEGYFPVAPVTREVVPYAAEVAGRAAEDLVSREPGRARW